MRSANVDKYIDMLLFLRFFVLNQGIESLSRNFDVLGQKSPVLRSLLIYCERSSVKTRTNFVVLK